MKHKTITCLHNQLNFRTTDQGEEMGETNLSRNLTPFADTAGYNLTKSFKAVKKDNYAKSQFLYIYPQC